MNRIDVLLKNRVSFLTDSKSSDDIAISSRVRLARNLARFPFPVAANDATLTEIRDLVCGGMERCGALGRNFLLFDMEETTPIDRAVLFERRLVSKELLERKIGAALLCGKDEAVAAMVNEEDHLRLQSIVPGFRLEEAYRQVASLNDALENVLEFAFDDTLGYLTSCPTNVGTGIRASVMLHLPALVLTGEINAAVRGIGKLNLAVRGIFGEGTDNRGNLFQVSNQSTLGESELQIIHSLDNVIKQLILHEKNARNLLLDKNPNMLLDKVGRAYGILRHAYKLSGEEALNALSFMRIGVDLGMFSNVDIATVNELFINIGDAHLQKKENRAAKSADELDAMRAAMVRERLRA